jgi:hypothetical protein
LDNARKIFTFEGSQINGPEKRERNMQRGTTAYENEESPKYDPAKSIELTELLFPNK